MEANDIIKTENVLKILGCANNHLQFGIKYINHWIYQTKTGEEFDILTKYLIQELSKKHPKNKIFIIIQLIGGLILKHNHISDNDTFLLKCKIKQLEQTL